MTHFHACTGCALKGKPCASREALAAAVKGLGVSSIRHRCKVRVPTYEPGAAVLILTHASSEPSEDDEPRRGWFPGIFIRQSGTQVIAFIAPGAVAAGLSAAYPFEPQRNGFVKAPFSRIKPSDHAPPADMTHCSLCDSYPAFQRGCRGHDEFGRRVCPLRLQQPEPASNPEGANRLVTWETIDFSDGDLPF